MYPYQSRKEIVSVSRLAPAEVLPAFFYLAISFLETLGPWPYHSEGGYSTSSHVSVLNLRVEDCFVVCLKCGTASSGATAQGAVPF